MNIDELFQLAKQPGELSVPNQWTQGRTVFGGLSAALVYVAIKQQVAGDRVLRSFNTNFVGPLLPNEPFSIDVTLLREGANVTQIIGKAIQQDKVCVMSQACFGVARDSKIVVENTLHNKKHRAVCLSTYFYYTFMIFLVRNSKLYF